jgi:hypothetical protein
MNAQIDPGIKATRSKGRTLRRFQRKTLALTTLLISTTAIHADTIAVTSTAEDLAPGTLWTAMLTAKDGDVIELPNNEVFQMSTIFGDGENYTGPTATPMIKGTIVIEANGSRLEHAPNGINFRAFAVGKKGRLTIRNAHIKGFTVKGGDGADGGGGGLGAGGAIYVREGVLLVDKCTFEGNGAVGGNGGAGHSGGGGGLGGNGGPSGPGSSFFGGGGGGGSMGNGAAGQHFAAGGGGGTVYDGSLSAGGLACGGHGGDGDSFIPGGDDGSSGCEGGGGGGGESRGDFPASLESGDGGDGGYGGGGGGGGYPEGDGGHGGAIGGGGGAGGDGEFGDAGDGGFGGGGGSRGFHGDTGHGGTFAGGGNENGGGGGGALGGAIFNDAGDVTIQNSTFTGNFVAHGLGGADAGNGADAGGAIFSVDGLLLVQNSTVAGNEATGSGGGVVFYSSSRSVQGLLYGGLFFLWNNIIANNGADECGYRGNLNKLSVAGSGNLVLDNGNCPGVAVTTDPQLQALALNPAGLVALPSDIITPTMALPPGSSAINAGDDAHCLTEDQRGVPRPQGAHCDIGAYEFINYFPIAQCQDVTVSAGATCTADASINNQSYDLNPGDILEITQEPPGPYPVGTTKVKLVAKDLFGEISICYGLVTVVDDTPPFMDPCPANQVADATSPNGAVVGYSIPAAKDTCSPTTVTATPPPNSVFPIGTTVVTISAVDGANNKAQCSFTVTVKGAAAQLADLSARVTSLPDVSNGTKTALVATLDAAASALQRNDPVPAGNAVQAFSNLVQAQAQKKIPLGVATDLINNATRIRAVIGSH